MRRSSTSARPDPIFFTDRDLGPTVAEALRAGGLQVEAYHEHFALDNVPDGEWLRFVGENGWIALSHNKRIRYETDELDDLMTYGVKAFFIVGKGPHPAFAAAVLDNINRIKRLIRKNPGSFVAKVYQGRSEVELWVTHQQWQEGRRSRR
jgi:hypothetical protein